MNCYEIYFHSFSVFRKVHGGYLDRVTFTSGECFVLEMVSFVFRIQTPSINLFAQVIDNLKQTPNLVVALLEELESRLADQEMRSMAWKLADEEDGYKVRH